MKKQIKANEKGAVLLTVICFTTIAMMIASLALSMSHQTMKVSTQNVSEIQAEVLAENYLQEFVNSFSGNYASLRTLAGPSESNPTKFNAALADASGSAVAATGTCEVQVYKSGSGIVVKTIATYGEQSEIASAYFEGQPVTPYESNNALETNGSYNVTDIAAPTTGDMLIENPDVTTITKFHNNNGEFKTNIFSNGNLFFGQGSTTQKIRDTIRDSAPTITAIGNIVIYNIDIQTTVGKIDASGLRSFDSGYDRGNLLNKDGYINTDSKVIIFGQNKIGSSTNPIDVYCRGAFFGSVPASYSHYDYSTSTYVTKTTSEALANELNDNNRYGAWPNSNGGMQLYGNVYSYKGAGSNQDGDFVLTNYNTTTINGDLVVDGDIYILNLSAKLNVTGNVYCTGEIYDCNGWRLGDAANFKENCINKQSADIIKGFPSDLRKDKPAMDYAPGLYEYGNPDKENPTMTMPSTYTVASPNAMYAANNDDSKYIKDKYRDALAHTLLDNYGTDALGNFIQVSYDYTDDSDLVDGNGISVYKSCRLTQAQATKENSKITIKMTTEDVVILLPVAANKEWDYKMETQIKVDNSAKVGDVFCYIMFYNPETYDPAVVDNTDPKHIDNNMANNFYTATTANLNYRINGQNRPSGTTMIGDTQFSPNFNSGTINVQPTTNIMVLLPDGMQLIIDGGKKYIEAIVFGPNANYKLTNNVASKVYGQLKVNSYQIDQNQNESILEDMKPADGSILGYINSLTPPTGGLDLMYYTKHKS